VLLSILAETRKLMEKVKRNNGGNGTIDINVFGYTPPVKDEDIIKVQELVVSHYGSENLSLAREVFEALGILEEYRNK